MLAICKNTLYVDQSDKPVALILRGQAADFNSFGRTLPSLSSEIDSIQKTLEQHGYDVIIFKRGSLEELEGFLDQRDIRERLVIFHYAGHANNNGLLLQDRNGIEYTITPDELAVILAPCISLRILFLNGCHGASQLERIDNALLRRYAVGSGIDYAFIGAVGSIDDHIAAAFSISIYNGLASGKDIFLAVQDVTIKIRNLANSKKLDLNKTITSLRFDPRQQKKFLLKDGLPLVYHVIHKQSRNISLKPFNYTIPSIAVLGSLFAYAAYSFDTSPAFQAAFGLQPIRELQETSIIGGDLYGSCELWQEEEQRWNAITEILQGPINLHHGRLIDIIRTIILSISFYLMLQFSSLLCFPKNVPLLSLIKSKSTACQEISLFIKTKVGIGFLFVFLIGSVLLIKYHFIDAPWNLAYFWPRDLPNYNYAGSDYEKRWVLLHCFDAIWANAGMGVRSIMPEGVWPEFIGHNDGTNEYINSVYKALYVYPYAWLFGNSVVNFLFFVIPMAYLTYMIARYSWYWTNLSLRNVEILFRSPEANSNRILLAINHACRNSQYMTRVFCKISATLATVGLFEVTLGYVTLAAAAQLLTTIAVLLLAFAVSRITLLILEVENHKRKFYDQIFNATLRESLFSGEELKNALERMRPMRLWDYLLIFYTILVIAVSILVLSGNSYILEIAYVKI